MPLINCKVHRELNWIEHCILCSAGDSEQLSEGFKRSAYWNSYQTKGVAGPAKDETGIKDDKKYFLLRGEIKNYNVLIGGRNFYDQPINDLIK